MLAWIIQIIIISILFILLVHHLFFFFKNTLTVPKIKDLVRSTTKKYENIYSIINNSSTNNVDSNYLKDSSYIHLLPTADSSSNMKTELKNFLKDQLNEDI